MHPRAKRSTGSRIQRKYTKNTAITEGNQEGSRWELTKKAIKNSIWNNMQEIRPKGKNNPMSKEMEKLIDERGEAVKKMELENFEELTGKIRQHKKEGQKTTTTRHGKGAPGRKRHTYGD